jgi:uncharacterized protein (DUF2141 family)
LASAPASAAAPPPDFADLGVTVTGLNSARGVLRYCIAPRGTPFPDCDGKAALSGSAPIHGGKAEFGAHHLAAGHYAVAVFHDRNNNGRLDTFMGIPREGYGFSRNPGFKPRAPHFDEAALDLAGDIQTDIRMRYIL